MPESFRVPLGEIRPSQLYLDESKLSSVIEWFDFESPNYDPLPIRKIGGDWTLTDGHSRAFAAYLSGADELRLVRDTDDISVPTYKQCLSWCEAEGITEVSNLAARVVTSPTFEEEWIERCRSLDP
ncbi:histone acetyltransferase [Haladaptatus pallidirubidus]|uniref:Histone acetyltransferase n=1 Tax=Haladaptatus pallidirubidus TaxID=1008152 RepID=A0AAV3UC77_9EURY|nr:hypothetical protein [Haladaptatus pallidirubidus]